MLFWAHAGNYKLRKHLESSEKDAFRSQEMASKLQYYERLKFEVMMTGDVLHVWIKDEVVWLRFGIPTCYSGR